MKEFPNTFGEIASRQGLSATDVALMAGVDKSTISRIWFDERWVDHVQGSTLQALTNVIPGLSKIVSYTFLYQFVKMRAYKLEQQGVIISPEKLMEYYNHNRISAPNFVFALHVIEAIASKSKKKIINFLFQCWNVESTKMLYFVFRSEDVIQNKQFFLLNCLESMESLSHRSTSFSRGNSAYTFLAHHLIKIGYESDYLQEQQSKSLRGFEFRGCSIAEIINVNDDDIYNKYKKIVTTDPFQMCVERFAYPSFCSDIPSSIDFTIPKNVSLVNSSAFFLSELNQANSVYTRYLLEIQLPSLIALDRTFGGKLQLLVFTLNFLQSKWENDNQILKLISNILLRLA